MTALELTQFRYTPYNSKNRTKPTASTPLPSGSEEPLPTEPKPKRGQEEPHYPVGHQARKVYTTTSGKRLTPYQWKVYDFILRVPAGKVTTYRDVAQAIGGSARAAGTALSKNPFSPYVPCHRVITSDLSIGGFFGQKNEKGKSHPSIERKRALLAAEGVLFDGNGRLCKPDLVVQP
ncbi:hypothetical protein CC1G_11101 [Coprinopsis cinerea okayama7|uniref:Methylated-DNA--protein-cysteine methyltransferase n=1 Tax=Coprinopsis cinerea (strain Okayama-7 / 130 / ATCC MYA-4618 / FGSC 9003) TaxID=240176 RepID=A8P7P1_COPC7|nr:hypothetical protein CC1G_11101 [Coprinopsis cinerea okayama7\|eukprot:XP_001839401.2 hypothetical protein CC1G_11101 [Coprinopsis cinerea okayama7\